MKVRIIHRIDPLKEGEEYLASAPSYTLHGTPLRIVVNYPIILEQWNIGLGGEENDPELHLLADLITYAITHEIIFAMCFEDGLIAPEINDKISFICEKLGLESAKQDNLLRQKIPILQQTLRKNLLKLIDIIEPYVADSEDERLQRKFEVLKQMVKKGGKNNDKLPEGPSS